MRASTIKLVLVGLLATGVFLPACDQVKKMTGGEPAEPEVTTVTETTNNTQTPPETPPETPPAATPDAGADTKPADAGADTPAAADAGADAPVEVDEAKFLNAFYESTCVKAHITDEEKQKEILAKVMERYEFSAEDFEKARGQMEEKESIKIALKTRMEKCNKKAAESYLTVGSTEEVEKPKTPKAPSFEGTRTQSVNSAGINGQLRLNFTNKSTVNGTFTGKREGAFFNIPLQGTVAKDGGFRGIGKQGTNRVSFQGRVSKTGATGVMDATINKQSAKIMINAK